MSDEDGMSAFDEQPDGDPHGECAAEIHRLDARIAELEAALTNAAREVIAERRRQIELEGWSPEHDDEHRAGQLARAGAAYAVVGFTDASPDEVPALWPFDYDDWKPKDLRRNLVRGASLILAEIERLDRAPAGARAALKREAP